MAPRYDTFCEVIENLQGADPSKGIVLVDSRFRETFHPYEEIYARVRALGRRFVRKGVRRGEPVLLAFDTDIDTIAAFLGLIRIGAIPFSVAGPPIGQDRDAYRRRIAHLIARHRVSRLLASKELAGLPGSVPEVPAEKALDPSRPAPAELADASPLGPDRAAPDDVVFVQFSSGSTADPKGVRITHRGLLYNLGLLVDNDRRTHESVTVSWLPLYHDMGLVGCLLTNLIYANTLVLMHPRCFLTRPVTWLAAITRHRGTVTAVPNFALDICTERVTDEQLREHALDLKTFRYVYNGSEPVRVSSIRRFEERFAPFGFVRGSIYPVYGMAETTLVITAPRFGDAVAERRVDGADVPSVGHPLGDFEIEIADENGAPVGRERVGEIRVRGTSVTPGYLDAATAPGEALKDGWLATGDLGLLDAEGRLFITGRKKDLLIVQGRNYYGHDIAADIEEGIGLRAGSVYVFSVDQDGREAVIVMLALPRAGVSASGEEREGSVDEANLRRGIRDRVHREFGLTIDEIVIVERIPKTTSGKIVRHLCERMYREGRG